MAITTSESIKQNKGPRCDRCAKQARGGVVLFDANGKQFGVCCATGWDKVLLEGMVGDAEPEPEPEQTFIAHDPLDHEYGVPKSMAKEVIRRQSLTKHVLAPVNEKVEIIRGGGGSEFGRGYRQTDFGNPGVVDEIEAHKAWEAQERTRPLTEAEEKFYEPPAPVKEDGSPV